MFLNSLSQKGKQCNVKVNVFSGTRDFKTPVDLDDLEVAEQNFCKRRDVFGCRCKFSNVFQMLMSDHSLTMPRDAEERKILFTTLYSLLQGIV